MIFGKGKKETEQSPFKRPLESAAINRWRSVDRSKKEETEENTKEISFGFTTKEHRFTEFAEDPTLFSLDEVAPSVENTVADALDFEHNAFEGDTDEYTADEYATGEENAEIVLNLSTVIEEDSLEVFPEEEESISPMELEEEPLQMQAPKPPRERTPTADFSLSVEQDISNRFGTNLKSALGSGTVIEGIFSFEDPVKIDGILRGEIKSSSALIVGPKAEVSAKIQVGSLIILGSVEGDIEVEDLIEVRKTGSLEGDIVTRRLALEEGGIFRGACTMID